MSKYMFIRFSLGGFFKIYRHIFTSMIYFQILTNVPSCMESAGMVTVEIFQVTLSVTATKVTGPAI